MEPQTQDPLVGTQLGSSYTLVRRIGAGGMGAVYEARHRQLGRRAAVKILNKEMAQDPQLLERFRREARITASFNNPHVVKVLESDVLPDGVPYIVMEYLEGEDLEARLKRQKRLTVDQVLELVRGTAAALGEAHAAGVVHRDIKPGNLFYAREGGAERVKLLDFGIARSRKLAGEGLTVFGQVLGTVWYMSPEQARGEELTSAADIYALGVVVFEALSGELPFTADTPHQYLFRLQQDVPRSIIQLCPELPLGIETLFARALARDPAARPRSATELQQAFEDLFLDSGDKTNVRPLAPPPPPAPPKKALTDPRLRPAPPAPPKAPTDPRMRAAPPAPPKAPTDPRLRAAPSKVATDPRLRSAPPKIATDPRLRAVRPPEVTDPMREEEGSTQIARISTPPTPTAAVRFTDPITLDEDEPHKPSPPVVEITDRGFDRPGPPVSSPFDGTDVALPTAEALTRSLEDSTRVLAAPVAAPALEESTRVVAAPSFPPPAGYQPELDDATHVGGPEPEPPAEPTRVAAAPVAPPERHVEPTALDPRSPSAAPDREVSNGRTVAIGAALGLCLLAVLGVVLYVLAHR